MSKSLYPVIDSTYVLRVVKGCPALGLRKGELIDVMATTHHGADLSHAVSLRVRGHSGVAKTVWAKSQGTLKRWEFNLGDGSGTNSVRVERTGYSTHQNMLPGKEA